MPTDSVGRFSRGRRSTLTNDEKQSDDVFYNKEDCSSAKVKGRTRVDVTSFENGCVCSVEVGMLQPFGSIALQGRKQKVGAWTFLDFAGQPPLSAVTRAQPGAMLGLGLG